MHLLYPIRVRLVQILRLAKIFLQMEQFAGLIVRLYSKPLSPPRGFRGAVGALRRFDQDPIPLAQTIFVVHAVMHSRRANRVLSSLPEERRSDVITILGGFVGQLV